MNYEKDMEVFNYVKENASEHLSTIIRAIVHGVNEENKKIRLSKSKVEVGLVLLLEETKFKKIPAHQKPLLIEALNHATFFDYSQSIKNLTDKKL